MRPDHIKIGKEYRTFLPLYEIPTAQEMRQSLCASCDLACFTHPMVSTERPYVFTKLCTLHVIKHGIVSRKEILATRK